MRKVLINLSISILSIAIFLAILEFGFRLIESLHKSSNSDQIWAIYDKDLGYRLRPNYADFNSDGLRDHPIPRQKKKFRILMLGDSVPFYGDSIEDTFVGHLEKIVNTGSDSSAIRVINAGIKGYTNYQELVYLKKFGLHFKPDVVGISFVLNDLHHILHQFEVKDGKIVGDSYTFTEEAVRSVESPLYRLARKSHFLVWLRNKLSIFESLVEWKTADGFSFDFRPDFDTAWKDSCWLPIEEQLREMKTLGNENGFKMFLVIFPFGEQLRADYLQRDYDYVTKPQRKLSAICEDLQIPHLDLFDKIDREKHLLEDQIHLTSEGRIFVAKQIASFLRAENLIPNSRIAADKSKENG